VTLRDYLRVLRAHRALILLVALVFVGAAYLTTRAQDKIYSAEASLSFTDPTEDLDYFGTAAPNRGTPQETASVQAERVDTPRVARRVRRALHVRNDPEALLDDVSARPEALTNFVVIEATSTSPKFAAQLANEFARQAQILEKRRVQRKLDRTAASLRREYRQETRRSDDAFARSLFNERVSRVDALRDITEPVEIVREADVPDSADSPKTVRNTMLGLLIGLTLGVIAAFVRDSLDVKLRGAEQAQAHFGLPLLGQVSNEALGRAPVASNGNAGLSPVDSDAFHIVRANLAFLDPERPTRSVAVTSALAEEGKSTVAASLAWSHVMAGQRAVLIECDLRRPTLAKRLGLRPAPGLVEYLTGAAQSREIFQSIESPAPQSGNGAASEREAGDAPRLDCVTAGAMPSRAAELLGSPAFRDFLAVISRSYDMTVLDCGPLLSVVDTLELVPHVEAIVVVARAGRTTRDQAHAARAALERFPERPTGLVVTGIRRLGKDEYGYYYAETDAKSK
jgi:polysaccharide biosynthesis transport protein